MAARAKKSQNGAAPARTTTRAYTVVRTDGSTLTVLDASRKARSQSEAMSAVVSELPAAERNGCFGAFLAGSYRETQFTTEQTFVTRTADRQPSFFDAPVPDAA